MAIHLYHNDMSTCSQKVRMALAGKGQDFDSTEYDLRAGEHRNPDYLKLNPNGVVPTIVHDGTVVIESTVIGEYLDDAFPAPPLRPQNPFARARMRQWTKQLDEGVHAMAGVISYALVFRHQILATRTREEVERMIDAMPAARHDFMRQNILGGLDSAMLPGAVARYRKVVADMDAALADAPWLAGAAFSLADIGYAPYIMRLDDLKMAWMWDKAPRVADWWERVRAREEYRVGVEKWINAGLVTLMNGKGEEAAPRLKQMAAG